MKKIIPLISNLALFAEVEHGPAESVKKVKSTCVYADSDGESHFKDFEIELEESNFAPPAVPLNVSSFRPATDVGFLITARGWHGGWHPAPQRLLVAILAGRIEIEVSDGAARTFGVGDILYLEDTTGKGHMSRAVGSTESLYITVKLPTSVS